MDHEIESNKLNIQYTTVLAKDGDVHKRQAYTDSLGQEGLEHSIVLLFGPTQYRPSDDVSGLLQYLCSVLWPEPHVTEQPE